ncbi:MAG: hypothetical protein Alis3KO_25790 [Aliiglaciecola sp.]
MSISLFSKANLAFKNANYREAISLYRLAGRMYGNSIVRFNIELCKSRLDSHAMDLPQDLYVLLSSTAATIKDILPTLESLRRQSMKPKEIILTLSKDLNDPAGISFDSPFLKKIKEMHTVRIMWTNGYSRFNSFGPFLKNHFDCEIVQNKLLVCVSESRVYPKDMLESLFIKFVQNDNLASLEYQQLETEHNQLPFQFVPKLESGIMFNTLFFNENVCDVAAVEKFENLSIGVWLTAQAYMNGLRGFEEQDMSITSTKQYAIEPDMLVEFEKIISSQFGISINSLASLSKRLAS